jgi:hypothetical protein
VFNQLLLEKGQKMSKRFLKIKIKQLASEATDIRQEEIKTKKNYRALKGRQGLEHKFEHELEVFWKLRNHRNGPVRTEARDSQLAYAYIRGKGYRYAELSGNPLNGYSWNALSKVNVPMWNVNIENIARLATKYGDHGLVTKEQIIDWLTAGINEMSIAA